MAFKPRHYNVKSKKSVLFEIMKDLKESEKKLGVSVSTKMVHSINVLSVEVRNSHADDTFQETIDQYREKHYVHVELMDFPFR